MGAEKDFRKFLHTSGPVKSIKMCPQCGKPTVHQLTYYRQCGKKTEWMEFDTWLKFSTFIINRSEVNRRDNYTQNRPGGQKFPKWSADPAGWPLKSFTCKIRDKMEPNKSRAYLCGLTYWPSLYIVFEECGIKYPYKKGSK